MKIHLINHDRLEFPIWLSVLGIGNGHTKLLVIATPAVIKSESFVNRGA